MAPDTPFLHELGLFRVSLAWDEALSRAIVKALLPYDMMKIAKSGKVGSVAEFRDAINDARIKAVVGPVMER